MAEFKYKGYILTQEEKENHHYMLWDSDGNFLMHAAHEGGLFTQAEAEHQIENYIGFLKDNNVRTLFKGYEKHS